MKHDHNHTRHADIACLHCGPTKRRTDFLLWGSTLIIVASYISYLTSFEFLLQYIGFVPLFVQSVFDLVNTMWWGIMLGMISVGLLGTIPRELIVSILGRGGTFSGLLRATAAGFLLDLCSHGILLVGTKLYERGASTGQMMAFLIASPWNSFSLTLILWSLVGFKWMAMLLVLSLAIGLLSGFVFDRLVEKGVLPKNPHHVQLKDNFSFRRQAAEHMRSVRITPASVITILRNGIIESRMVVRWIFFGIILASLIRTFMIPSMFAETFGPTLLGLGATLAIATILEICSEGSMPVAADILTKAHAAGNAFGFLMTGVATDYTEIMAIRETTRSWKTALFLPLVTLPQVIAIAVILNQMSV